MGGVATYCLAGHVTLTGYLGQLDVRSFRQFLQSWALNIMQSCIADDINNNYRNNVSRIWQRILIYFHQIANHFAFSIYIKLIYIYI